MCAKPGVDPEEIIRQNPDFSPAKQDEIERIVNEVLAREPQSVEDYRAGRAKALDFLVGQVMKASRGKAPPQLVNELLLKHLNAS